MAVSLQEVEFELPAEFLNEEDQLLMDKDINAQFDPSLCFPTEFPYEFDSFSSSAALYSPLDDSVFSSTDSDTAYHDDFLSSLTRQQLAVKPEKQEKWVLAGSPESTLSGIGSWSASSNGSPNGVLSPPTTPFGHRNDTWDLIYEAAGQVARLKMSNESNKCSNFNGRGLLGPSRNQTSLGVLKNQNSGFYSSQSFGRDASQMVQYQHHMRQEPTAKPQSQWIWGNQQLKVELNAQHQRHIHEQQQIQSSRRNVSGENGRCTVPPLGLSHSPCPPLQAQPNRRHQLLPPSSNSGMRAVFLGGSGVKRQCAGTGVFLPRRYGDPSESKKKPACSTVLLPAKVVQALNLNLDDINLNGGHTHLPRFNSGHPSDYDVLMARRNAVLAQQKRSLRSVERVMSHDISLPQDWIY